MRETAGKSPAARIRRSGIRASRDPWTLYASRAGADGGRLIVALGRAAGRAVVRSRIRRLARHVFRLCGPPSTQALDLLLLVRRDVGQVPRRKIRTDLAGLLARVPDILRRREAEEVKHEVAAAGDPGSP